MLLYDAYANTNTMSIILSPFKCRHGVNIYQLIFERVSSLGQYILDSAGDTHHLQPFGKKIFKKNTNTRYSISLRGTFVSDKQQSRKMWSTSLEKSSQSSSNYTNTPNGWYGWWVYYIDDDDDDDDVCCVYSIRLSGWKIARVPRRKPVACFLEANIDKKCKYDRWSGVPYSSEKQWFTLNYIYYLYGICDCVARAIVFARGLNTCASIDGISWSIQYNVWRMVREAMMLLMVWV